MPIQRLFPTLVYSAPLSTRGGQPLNKRLLRECLQLEHDDESGRRWSAKNYHGGYTSYGSASRMHELSPTFAQLQRYLNRHIQSFARSLAFDLEGRQLAMTDCWVNVMREHVTHDLHLHPLSTLSGTYYVQTPKGSPGLKLEDPRLDRFMAAPPRGNRSWVVIPAQAGRVLVFESWLRHQVPPHRSRTPRVSISFNYNWF
jgi:uncharacterized protein (TIGR02466 family)